MTKNFPTLLTTLIWAALHGQSALATLNQQCMLGVPIYDKPLVADDPNQLPVNIQADKTTVNASDSAQFTGNVNIQQGNRTLTTQQATLKQIRKSGQPDPTRIITVTGDVHYIDNYIALKGPKGWSNLSTKDTDMYQASYQMVGQQGRGYADTMKVRDTNRYTILENGTFTSCLPGDNSWSVVGSEVIHDRKEQVAEVWNARFKIGSVPIFYSPYLQLPIGDKRHSGFLIPNGKYTNKSGFELILPYYWNLAPNYDATFTPHYISQRGLQWQNEFRYLTVFGTGVIAFDWLQNDKEYAKDYPDANSKNRSLFNWKHAGVMDQVWRFNIDYTKASDPQYFTDFTSVYGSTTDGYATQKFSVGYANQNWDIALASKQFQVFAGSGNQNAYRVQPELALNYYQNDIGPFDMHIYGQAAKFTSVDPDHPEATRWHIEPTVSLPLANSWGHFNTDVKLMATHYQQTVPAAFTRSHTLKNSVNRLLPQYKVDGKMVLDRDMVLAKGFTQTLEPRAQYLYIPYRNQNDIYPYDSTLLQTDYTGLFRDRTYSGLDRIASANQLATGLTSRIYDDELVERFNVSVGQIYYFNRSRAEKNRVLLDENRHTGSLVWVGEGYWKVDDRLALKGGLQYDTLLGNLSQGNAVMEYHRDAGRMLQLNYRYTSPEYILATLPKVKNQGYQQGISQVGAITSLPITDRWAVVGAYYYDLKAQQSANQLVGLQYSTCCWAMNAGYEHKITTWDALNSHSKYDHRVSFNIELRGLSARHSLNTSDMLRFGILPYQRAF